LFELVPPGTHIDFVGKRNLCLALSLGVILVSLAAIPFRGVRLGIDFAGGSEVQVRFAPGVPADEGRIRAVLGEMGGMNDASVIRYGDPAQNEFLIKVAGDVEQTVPTPGAAEAGTEAQAVQSQPPAPAAATPPAAADGTAEAGAPPAVDRVVILQQRLEKAVGAVSIERVEFVGPRVGRELQSAGLKAFGLACLFIVIYIAFRFSPRFAPGAVVALVHDVLITAGVFVILGLEFDLTILAALLAILGYSLNDTIIVYDRVRENLALHTKADLPEVLNLSVNQTLSRTILTSGTTLVAVLCLLALGGEVIWPFAFAMTIGVVVGTYSSIYIASPLLLVLEERYAGGKGPGSRGAGGAAPTPARGAGKGGKMSAPPRAGKGAKKAARR
jgi:preprotein translocase subunit SecF